MEQLQRLVAEQQKIIALYNPGTWGIPPDALAPSPADASTPAVKCGQSLKEREGLIVVFSGWVLFLWQLG